MENPYSPPSAEVKSDEELSGRSERWLIRTMAALCFLPLIILLLQLSGALAMIFVGDMAIRSPAHAIVFTLLNLLASVSFFAAGVELLKRRKRAAYFMIPFIIGVAATLFYYVSKAGVFWLAVSTVCLSVAIVMTRRGCLR